MFIVAYSHQARKFLKQTNTSLARRLTTEIEQLCKDHFPHGVKRIEGYAEKLFRVRVGDYRILYEVDHNRRIIGIVKIDKRSKVYD